MLVPFLFIVITIYLIVYITIKLSRSRKDVENERDAEAQRYDRFTVQGAPTFGPAVQRTVRQTYIISPVYTIEANREPVSYEAALSMPRTTRSIEITNKSYDDDLPSYDQAIVNSKLAGIVNVAAVTVPIPVSNAVVR